ncbi:MAG: hypothetical protein GXO91_04080 [FCB group bacterium]|nr:hypothetical protein [FCB group bacterium]
MKFYWLIISLAGALSFGRQTTDPYAAADWQTRQALNNELRDMLPEQTWYDVISYSIAVEIFPSSETIDGSVTIELRALQNDVTEIVLDAADHLTIDSISSNGLTGYTHQNDRLHLFYSAPLVVDQTVSAQIVYHGDTNSGYIWSGGINYSGNYFWSLDVPYGLSKWVPCKDHPSDKADWLDLQLTAPAQYVVAANGVRLGITDNNDGTHTTHWHESHAIATYLFCINAYPYNEYTAWFEADGEQMPILYFVPNTVPSGFQYVETALPVFSDLFGLYPFFDEKYAIAKVPGNFGAMEHQNCVTTSVTSGMTMVHELSHQWFGDLVTCETWQHSWLNEGFATYCEALYVENTQSPAAYHNYMNGLQFNWNDNLTVFVTDTSNFAPIFNNIVYDKGAWVNHMLRKVVGDSTYFETLRDYLDTYAFANATTEDLKNMFELHTGGDMDWFFDEWIYRNGHPEYDYQWASTSDTFYLVVDQTNTGDGPELFTMPVEFELDFAGDSSRVESFWIEDSQSAFELPVSATVTAVTCDPDNWVLNTATGSGTTEFSLGDPEITLSDEDDSGFVDPGETFFVDLQLTNLGIPFGELIGTLTCSYPGVDIVQGTSVFPPAGLGNLTSNAEPFELTLSDPFETAMIEFSLQLSWESYTDQISFDLPLGTPYTLLVNYSGDPSLTQIYADVLAEAGQVAALWDSTTPTDLADLIPQFRDVLWLAGDNDVDPLPAASQELLQEHVSQGKNLLVMGQNIGNVLGAGDFFHNVLQAEYVGEHQGYIIYGNDDDPVIQGANLLISHPEDCDVLAPLNGAGMAYEYSGNNGAAGIISDTPGRLLYTGFDLSKILTTGWGQTPGEFMTMVMEWFNRNLVPGDVNQDDLLDILDVVVTVNIIMGVVEPTVYQLTAADLNEDGEVNVLDVILMVNLIVGG